MREHIFLLDIVHVGDVLGDLQLAGFSPENFIDATTANPFEIQFKSKRQPHIAVSHVKDKRLGVSYLVIQGPEIVALRASLESVLPHYDRDTA